MADIFAQRGDLENAEIGYRHCITKQMEVMDKHLSNYFVSKGAHMEEFHKVEAYGAAYTDPLALFAMCLQRFAHFLIEFKDETREKEAQECMDEVLKVSKSFINLFFKLSYHIFGPSHPHSLHVISNFGAICIVKNRFETALKYLELGAGRIVHVDGCSDIMVSFYCNFAEALFHNDRFDEAMQNAETAMRLSKGAPESVQRYTASFLKDLKNDLRRARKSAAQKGQSNEQTSSSSWFGWLWGTSEVKQHPPQTTVGREVEAPA